MQDTKKEIRSTNPSIYSQDLINLLFHGPIIYAHQLVDAHVAGSLSTAHKYLKQLEESGIIVRKDGRIQKKIGYYNFRLVEALSGEIDLT